VALVDGLLTLRVADGKIVVERLGAPAD
jgi:hypothetical protein